MKTQKIGKKEKLSINYESDDEDYSQLNDKFALLLCLGEMKEVYQNRVNGI